jgi:hypothetical protein
MNGLDPLFHFVHGLSDTEGSTTVKDIKRNGALVSFSELTPKEQRWIRRQLKAFHDEHTEIVHNDPTYIAHHKLMKEDAE